MRRVLAMLVATALAGCTLLNPLDEYEGPDASGAAGSSGGAGTKGEAGTNTGGASGAAGGSGAIAPPGLIRGRVLGPDRVTPVMHARVSLVDASLPPAPRPRGATCGRCEPLADVEVATETDASGDLVLAPTKLGPHLLVVEKAGFRRVRPIEVKASAQTAPVGDTTLPGLDDPESGDEVPAMNVLQAHWDEVHLTLKEAGLSEKAFVAIPTEPNEEGDPFDPGPATKLLRDPDRLSKARFLFLPSGNLSGQQIDQLSIDLTHDAEILENLRRFVSEGGTLYVTDLHYDFVARAFPGFLTWKGQSDVACSGCACIECELPSWVDAVVADDDLSTWLGGQGIGAFSLDQAKTGIATVSSAEGPDATGALVSIEPRVWVLGRDKPTSNEAPAMVSFPYGCGSVVFSTYARPQFTFEPIPQVRALWGVFLEAASCPP